MEKVVDFRCLLLSDPEADGTEAKPRSHVARSASTHKSLIVGEEIRLKITSKRKTCCREMLVYLTCISLIH